MCEICKSDKSWVFTVEIDGKKARACSKCITSQHLTGWSK